MRMLVVDDEAEMAELLARGLGAEGHDVVVAHDGIDGLATLAEGGIEFAVLDVNLPGMSGFELCRRVKEVDPSIAVVLLTARDAVDDRVRGLDSGADDYLTKPFAFAELAARIRAVRRRDALATPVRLEVGDVVLDLPRLRVQVSGAELRLSRTEFDVLRTLAARADATVTRAELLAEVWDADGHIDPNVVDQYVSYLRRKLSAAGAGIRIQTVRGVGFTLSAESPEPL
ncbi:response regulator transcription factor [Schumannella soli]|uniref:Response regulator transcription factor n=1 Tax=Schumannella soli TaxID=2590779 RepID=A0A506YC05_9MICO|nr:response regulator transcription factor [Schumannella soli]TPW77959.1 response regulator transcription factor [Schumannella soli]